ncbi:methyltransferase, partial [Leptospira santarosai]|nr:methyltransferase [Leptospira santarosai]
IKQGSIVDLCSGNGVIPLFLSARTKAKITGVELQQRLADMANRSVSYNQLNEQITIVEGDVKTIPKNLGIEKHDVVTCNPPYFPAHEASNKNLK